MGAASKRVAGEVDWPIHALLGKGDSSAPDDRSVEIAHTPPRRATAARAVTRCRRMFVALLSATGFSSIRLMRKRPWTAALVNESGLVVRPQGRVGLLVLAHPAGAVVSLQGLAPQPTSPSAPEGRSAAPGCRRSEALWHPPERDRTLQVEQSRRWSLLAASRTRCGPPRRASQLMTWFHQGSGS